MVDRTVFDRRNVHSFQAASTALRTSNRSVRTSTLVPIKFPGTE